MSTHRITGLLQAWRDGDDGALAALTPIVHGELRKLARSYLRGERRDQTLQATGLVNECYLRLVQARQVEWQNRGHFFALSARLMRRILVDLARSWSYAKRGGDAVRVTLDPDDARLPMVDTERDLVALDDALAALATLDERKSLVVELKFFGGLGNDDIAAALGVSTKTVLREWQVAKLWLLNELRST
ncbi:MAG: ECF-type sigma factor [Pseudomonadota bacterium]